jgi:ribose transport system ATP-binding protein/rhamnose transport system ATP-binding protein
LSSLERDAPADDAPADSRGEASPILQIENLTKSFGSVAALAGVSMALRSGEVRAICGENGAGKSTLVKLLTGVHRPDSGRILIDGVPRDIRRPQEAQVLGLCMVAQELSLAPHLSVLDNIWLGSPEVGWLHRGRRFRDRAAAALATVGLADLDPDTPVGTLGIGQRQLVEISRLLARNARVMILDEPTASLSDHEIERIFAALRTLKAAGHTILYITHRLGEVFDICDSVTVLRNGALVDTRPVGEVDRDRLIEMMLGRSFGEMYPKVKRALGATALTVEDLEVPGRVHRFAMSVAAGEIVSIAGQIGSGATEVARALAGLEHQATGRVWLGARRVPLRSVPRALANGIMFVSEDRAAEGIFLRLPVLDNLVATRLGGYARFGILAWRRLREVAARVARSVAIDTARLRSRAAELSGGNQQKIAFGRCVGRSGAGILILNEPTRGVDVGARAEIYQVMRDFCAQGFALVVTLSDIEEIVGVSDTVITMYRGRQVARYSGDAIDMHRILADITHPAGAVRAA